MDSSKQSDAHRPAIVVIGKKFRDKGVVTDFGSWSVMAIVVDGGLFMRRACGIFSTQPCVSYIF